MLTECLYYQVEGISLVSQVRDLRHTMFKTLPKTARLLSTTLLRAHKLHQYAPNLKDLTQQWAISYSQSHLLMSRLLSMWWFRGPWSPQPPQSSTHLSLACNFWIQPAGMRKGAKEDTPTSWTAWKQYFNPAYPPWSIERQTHQVLVMEASAGSGCRVWGEQWALKAQDNPGLEGRQRSAKAQAFNITLQV